MGGLVRMAVGVAFVFVIVVILRMVVIMAMRMVTVAVPVPARGIRPVFRLKAFVYRVHDQVHGAQHVGQHVVGLDLQVVGLKLNGHMPVAQVVGGAYQVIRRAVLRAVRNFQHRLRRGDGADKRSIVRHQHIAPTHHRAARQKNAQAAALRVSGVKTAFLAYVPIQFYRSRTLNKNGCEAFALRNAFGDLEHGCFCGGLRSAEHSGWRRLGLLFRTCLPE